MGEGKRRGGRPRFMPIKYRFAVALYTMVFSILVVMAVFVAALMSGYLASSGRESTRIQINQTNEILEQFYAAQIKKSDLIQLNPEIYRLLSSRTDDMHEALVNRRELGEWLERSSYDIKYSELESSNYYGGGCILSIYVQNDALLPVDGELERVRPYESAREKHWFRELEEGATFAWEGNVINSGMRYIAIYRKIVEPETLDTVAILQICVPVAKIKDFLVKNNMVDAPFILYTDDHNLPIWYQGRLVDIDAALEHLAAVDMGSGFSLIKAGEQELLLYSSRSDLNGWSLTCAVPTSRFWQGIRGISTVFLAVTLAAAVACSLLAIRIAGMLTARIKLLADKTERLGDGDFGVEESVGGNDEITSLDDSLIQMARRIRTFDQAELRFKMQIAEIRFELMQEQINPHLLYNTLSMIRLTAKKEEQTGIYELSSNLIQFYRRFLNEGRMFSSIADEIEMVRSYAEVAIRVYSLDVELDIAIDREVLALWSIKLFLQPIVENAIVHGIRPYQSGRVCISGTVEGGHILFTVEDTGQGIEEEVLEELHGVIALSGNEEGGGKYQGKKHFGIYNVARRIKLIFGPEYGLAIQSSVEGGTTATIRLPALTEEKAYEQYGSLR